MQANIYQQYKTESLKTLTKGEVVVKLFDEASKQINTSILLLERENAVGAYNCVAKAQKIVSALRNSLDNRFAISLQLSELYDYIYEELGKAIVKKDIEMLRTLSNMLKEFMETFRKADIIARTNSINK